MASTINSNIPSLKVDRTLKQKTDALAKNFEQLSSGKRINKSSDDPAGAAIVAALTAEGAAGGAAVRNISDGSSLADIADGGLQTASDITGRLSELATQSANGTLSDSQRASLQGEANALVAELDRISATTQFNGQQLLSGSSTTIQAGTDGGSDSQISLSLPAVSSSGLSLNSFDISTAASAQAALTSAKAASATISDARGEVGATQSRLEEALSALQVKNENTASSRSRIEDVDVAAAAASLVANRIGQQAGIAVKAQANQQPANLLALLK